MVQNKKCSAHAIAIGMNSSPTNLEFRRAIQIRGGTNPNVDKKWSDIPALTLVKFQWDGIPKVDFQELVLFPLNAGLGSISMNGNTLLAAVRRRDAGGVFGNPPRSNIVATQKGMHVPSGLVRSVLGPEYCDAESPAAHAVGECDDDTETVFMLAKDVTSKTICIWCGGMGHPTSYMKDGIKYVCPSKTLGTITEPVNNGANKNTIAGPEHLRPGTGKRVVPIYICQ